MFEVNLIVVFNGILSQSTKKTLRDNCTHVVDNFFIFEGDTEVLSDNGVKFNIMGTGIVDSLGGLSQEELLNVVESSFGYTKSDLEENPLKCRSAWSAIWI